MGKCSNCGKEYPANTKFCSECGGKIVEVTAVPQTMTMHCKSCGGTMSIEEDRPILHCPFCGSSELIAESDAVTVERIKQKTHKEIEMGRQQLEREKMQHEIAMTEEEKKAEALRKFKKGFMSKFLIIYMVINIIMCAVSFNDSRILSGLLAIVMAALSLFSFLMGMQVIKEKFKGMRVLATILAFVLIIPYFSLYNAGKPSYKPPKEEVVHIVWSELYLSEHLSAPEQTLGVINTNSDYVLSIDLHNIEQNEFKTYKEVCINDGYTIEPEDKSTTYLAFNSEGYKVYLLYRDTNKELNISLYAPKELSEFAWPTNGLATLLPKPKSNIGNIDYDSSDLFAVTVGDTTIEDCNEYISQCEGYGFTKDHYKSEGYYTAMNSDGLEISIDYIGFNQMYISVDAPDGYELPDNTSSVTTSTETTTTPATKAPTVPATTEAPKTEAPKTSEYEMSFVRALGSYDLYFMFDTDKNKFVAFSSQDTYVDKGTYEGDNFLSGVTLVYDHGEWTDEFKIDGYYAIYTDGNGFEWEYEPCVLEDALEILNKLE